MPKKTKRKKQKSSEKEFHRKIAVKCFNAAWNFLDKKDRSVGDDMQMLLLAHASRYHWSLIGELSNFAVGDWQLSRAYASLKQPELALLFAKSSLDLCERNNLSDLLLSAYEGLARAHVVAGNYPQARDFIKKAHDKLEFVTDQEDKKIYGDQINETEAMIPQ